MRPPKKLHKLRERISETDEYITCCRLKGVLVTVHHANHIAYSIHTADNHSVPLTDVNTDVTCVKCVRVLIGVTKPHRSTRPKFRSKHIRRAFTPLGLLKG